MTTAFPGECSCKGFFVESLWREEQIVLGVFLSLEAGAFLALCPGISRDVPAAFPKQEHASHKPESRLHAAAQNSPKNKTTREAVTVAVWTVQKTYPFLALWQQLDFLTLHSSNLPDAPAQGNLLSYPTGTAIFLAGATFNVQAHGISGELVFRPRLAWTPGKATAICRTAAAAASGESTSSTTGTRPETSAPRGLDPTCSKRLSPRSPKPLIPKPGLNPL